MRQNGHFIIGLIIIFLGASIFLSHLHLDELVAPLLFFAAGWYVWNRKHRLIGGILMAFGAIVFFEDVLHINIAGLLVAGVMVYLGYRLMRQDKKTEQPDDWDVWNDEELWDNPEMDNGSKATRSSEGSHHPKSRKERRRRRKWVLEDDIDREVERIRQSVKKAFSSDPEEPVVPPEKRESSGRESSADNGAERTRFHDHGPSAGHRRHRHREEFSSILGDFMLLNHRFELRDMRVNNGIGDVKIDLSKAVIPEGETSLEISGWLGDIHIYVPYDMEVSVQASVMLGDLDILDTRQEGITRGISRKTAGYDESSKRIHLKITLGLGDIAVRYV